MTEPDGDGALRRPLPGQARHLAKRVRQPRLSLRAVTVVGLVAAVFGPYTPLSGVRTEQVAVYATCLLLLAGGFWLQARPTRRGSLSSQPSWRRHLLGCWAHSFLC